jgi:hypothetical protein
MHEYKKARYVYENMEDSLKLDSTQTAMVQMRYKWLPVTGFTSFFNSFPTYALITPRASFYADNIGTRSYTEGLRLDLGVTSFLTVGVEGFRTDLSSNSLQVISNTFRWDFTMRLAERIIFGLDFGDNYYNYSYTANYTQPIVEIFLRTEDPNHYLAYGDYLRTDASQVIPSAYTIINRLWADLTKAGGYYQFNSGLKFSVDGTYLSFSDGNTGYNLALKLGKYFYPDFMLGFEYYTAAFNHTTLNYFSPTSYSTDNIFADWDIIKDTTITVTIGGLLGFVSNSSYILRQGYASATWKVFDRLTLTGIIAGGSSFLNVTGYSSFSGYFAAYWTL